jgi:UDP-glucose 4-epimerase
MNNKILVVGGAGFIGSHMVKKLSKNGFSPVVLDDLSGGFADAVINSELVIGSISDSILVNNLMSVHDFLAVMHFASFISVGESVLYPSKYYTNNVVGTFQLLELMRSNGLNKLIFSSTAAVYGNPSYVPIDENHHKTPINPYGRSKLFVEEMLKDYDKAYEFKSICLRYFNAAGADPDGLLGERHQPETHLIPLVLEAISGRQSHISIFGDDYDTPDGTCIRDYVHVDDLCEAHLLALNKLLLGSDSAVYNLGYGYGFSVKEVIDVAQKITGLPIKIEIRPRREGDPAKLIADAKLARSELSWSPRYDNLEEIIFHAWNWERRQIERNRPAWDPLSGGKLTSLK